MSIAVRELPEDFYEDYCIPCFNLKTSWNGSPPNQLYVPIYQKGHKLEGQTRNGNFGINNGTISFVNEKGLFFIAPYIRDSIRETLLDAGYVDSHLYVPLSNGEEIVDNELLSAKYKYLRAKQRAEY